ncbi:MAG: DUF6885 family protein [Thermoplasmatota archaeon]
MTPKPFSYFSNIDINVNLLPGFPEVHEAYRILREQKDLLCGAYSLTYVLHSYGYKDRDGTELTVDKVAQFAGSVLDDRNAERNESVHEMIKKGEIPEERAREWTMHDYFKHELSIDEEGAGTSPEGVVKACRKATKGELTAVPVPALFEGETQLNKDNFNNIISSVSKGEHTAQIIMNYNLKETLAPAGILGHKYNFLALLTHWDDPDYFWKLRWDVGHFTTLAGRLSKKNCKERYLLIRDSYKTFGLNGYHLQPEKGILKGLIREDDDRDGGLLLIIPSEDRDDLEEWLKELGLKPGLWDNGSKYLPIE